MVPFVVKTICLIRMYRVQVRLGEHDTSTTTDGPNVDVNIKKIITHPEYNKPFMSRDIAILELENDVDFSGKQTDCKQKSVNDSM